VPESNGNSETSAAKRSTESISGFEPQEALAKVTPSTAIAGSREISRFKSPLMARSRPVADFT